MNDKFFIGACLGMVIGAIIVTKSSKVKKMIEEGEAQVNEKLNTAVDNTADKLEDVAKETSTKMKKAVRKMTKKEK